MKKNNLLTKGIASLLTLCCCLMIPQTAQANEVFDTNSPALISETTQEASYNSSSLSSETFLEYSPETSLEAFPESTLENDKINNTLNDFNFITNLGKEKNRAKATNSSSLSYSTSPQGQKTITSNNGMSQFTFDNNDNIIKVDQYSLINEITQYSIKNDNFDSFDVYKDYIINEYVPSDFIVGDQYVVLDDFYQISCYKKMTTM